MDATRHIVELARGGRAGRPHDDRAGARHPAVPPLLDALRARRARALLLVEFAGDDHEEQLGRPATARRADGRSRLSRTPWSRRPTRRFRRAIWDVRKAGLNIMMSMKGDGKPVSFIEDCAVPLEHLADYTDAAHRGLREARHERHLVRARLGRLPACAPDPQPEAGAGRRGDARDRRGGVRDGARIQGRAFRRARRRPGALGVARGDVRRRASSAPSRRSRTPSTRRPVQPRQDRPARRGWTTAPCSASSRAIAQTPLDTVLDWSEWGGFARRRRDVQQQRRLPQVEPAA